MCELSVTSPEPLYILIGCRERMAARTKSKTTTAQSTDSKASAGTIGPSGAKGHRALLERRFAAKRFDGKRISAEQLAALKEAIRLSPSSYNSQPWLVTVVSDKKLLAELQKLSWDQPQVGTCSHLFVFSVPTDVPKHFEKLFAAMRASGVPEQNVAAFAGYVQGSLKARTPAQQVEWMQRQVYLAMMSLMTAAAELGLDSCPMEGFDPAGYEKALKLKGQAVTVVCPVGFATDASRPKLRFPEQEIFSER